MQKYFGLYISYKTLIGAKQMRIRFGKVEGFLKFMIELDI